MADTQVDNTATQATTPQQSTPTQATDVQKNAWEKMDLARQKEFVQKNTGFDPTKYNLSYKSATPAVTPAHEAAPSLDTQTAPTKGVELAVAPEDKTKKPDYANVETARLQEVQNNLSDYYQTQQDLFKDRNTYDSFFKYTDRAPEQKAVLDKFYTDKERERKITGKTAAQIAKDGDDVEFLKLTDPQLYNQIQQEKKDLTDKKDNTNTLLTLAQQYGFTDIDKNGVLDQFEAKTDRPSLTDTPEIAAVKTNLNGVDTQIAALDTQIDKIRKDVISQYPGVPESQISAIVTDRTNKLIDQKNGLINQKNSLNGEITTYQANQALAQKDFELAQGDLQAKITNFSNMYGLYQETPEGMAEMAMAKYNAENPDLNSSDEATATRALNQTLDTYFADYQKIIQRDKAGVVADVKAYAKANGISLSKALQENFIKPLMNKDEYKQMQDKALGLGADWTKINDTGLLFNAKTGEYKNYGGGTTYAGPAYTPVDGNKMATAVNTLLTSDKYKEGTVLARGECGEFVNDFLTNEMGFTGKVVTNTWAEKQAIKNSDEAKVGSVAIITSAAHPDNGHVAIVTKDNGDGTVHVKESNWAGDKTIHERDIKKTDIYGYFDPSKSSTSGAASGGYNPALASMYEKYNAQKLTAADQKWIAQMGIDPMSFATQAEAYKATGTTAVGKNDKLLGLIATAEKLKTMGGRLGASLGAGYIPRTQANAYKVEFQNLKKNLTLQVFKDAKAAGVTFGAMSEGEWKLLDEASSKMDMGLPEENYQAIMDDIITNLKKGLGGVATETVSTPIIVNNPRD